MDHSCTYSGTATSVAVRPSAGANVIVLLSRSEVRKENVLARALRAPRHISEDGRMARIAETVSSFTKTAID